MTFEPVMFYPIVMLVVVAGLIYYQRRVAAPAAEQQAASYRLGELARRLGLQIVEGAPTINVLIRAGFSAAYEESGALSGLFRGIPLSLYHKRKREYLDRAIGSGVIRTTSVTRLSAKTNNPIPSFEVVSRTTSLGSVNRHLALPEHSCGVPLLDAKYAFLANDPGLATYLGACMAPFEGITYGVHIVGEGTFVSFEMSDNPNNVLVSALYFAEQIAEGITLIARGMNRP